MKRLFALFCLVAAAAAVVAVAGCSQQPAQAPPVIINNLPASDGGLPVVVVVLAIALVFAVGGAVALWFGKRSAVQDKVTAENVVAALTGMTPEAYKLAQIMGAAGVAGAPRQRAHATFDQPMLDQR